MKNFAILVGAAVVGSFVAGWLAKMMAKSTNGAA